MEQPKILSISIGEPGFSLPPHAPAEIRYRGCVFFLNTERGEVVCRLRAGALPPASMRMAESAVRKLYSHERDRMIVAAWLDAQR